MKLSRVWKAVVAALVAGVGALGTAAEDGTVTGAEGLTVLGAIVVAGWATWRVPNKQARKLTLPGGDDGARS